MANAKARIWLSTIISTSIGSAALMVLQTEVSVMNDVPRLPLQDVFDPDEVLLDDGLVEAELAVEPGSVRGGVPGAEDDRRGVAGQEVDEVEGPDGDDKDDADQHDQPLRIKYRANVPPRRPVYRHYPTRVRSPRATDAGVDVTAAQYRGPVKRIAIAGGIGCGKIGRRPIDFESLGFSVVDADRHRARRGRTGPTGVASTASTRSAAPS